MGRLGAAECQEKDHNTYNGLIPIRIEGHHCSRPAHSGVSGLASQFPQGTELHRITFRKGVDALMQRTSRASNFFEISIPWYKKFKC